MKPIFAISVLAVTALAALPPRSRAQSAAPALHTPAPEVQLPVTVRDKHGALVTTLAKDDLTLTEDGRAQTIKSFAVQSELPFAVGLVVETSTGMMTAMEPERKAADKFIDQMLAGKGDAKSTNQLFLLHYDREVELLRDFTGDAAKLHSEIEDMSTTARSRDDRNGPEVTGDDRQRSRPGRGNAQLYDAIFLAADELMKPKAGRKVLVIFSDGVDRGSKETMNEALDAVDHAGLSIYTIYLKGEQERSGNSFPSGNQRGGIGGTYPGGGGYPGGQRKPSGGGRSDEPTVDGKKIMQQIAERTGGRFYEAKKRENLEEIYADIATELHGQYLLTYTPDMVDKEGGYHKVAIKAKKDELQVLTRAGYYAASGDGK